MLPALASSARAQEPPLELAGGVGEVDALVHHLGDEAVEVAVHESARLDQARSVPVSRRKASRYLSRVRATTSSGSEGTGGCLFQWMRSRYSRTNCLSKLGWGPPGAYWSAGQKRERIRREHLVDQEHARGAVVVDQAELELGVGHQDAVRGGVSAPAR